MKPRQLLTMKRPGLLAMTTLQQRISVAVTAVVTLFIIVQGLLAYSSLEEQEDELVDSIVISEAKRLVDKMATGDTLLQSSPQPVRLAPKLLAWLVPSDQSPEATTLPTHLAGLAEGPHRLYLQSEVLHAVVTPAPGGRLVVQYDATENEQFVYQFGIDLIATGALFIVLGWVISLLLARIVVAPFNRLARHLAQWAPGDEARPVGRSDEEAMLLQAFDAAQRRLDEALAREREFAANVRHEVRTPLTALRTDAELLLLTLSPAPEVRQRLERMIEAVDSIADGVEALHALSSAAPARTEAVDLNACVDSAWASLQHLNPQGRMQLRNRLHGEAHPVLDRQALMTVLRNLLRNAIEHASPGICEVRRTATGIEIADDGPGHSRARPGPHLRPAFQRPACRYGRRQRCGRCSDGAARRRQAERCRRRRTEESRPRSRDRPADRASAGMGAVGAAG